MELKDIITIAISLLALVVNVVFYILIAPRVNYKYKSKEKMHDLCSEYLDFLVGVTSHDDLEGIPTQVRGYSIRLQLMFKDGKAPVDLEKSLEEIYQSIKNRKKEAIGKDDWQKEMRNNIKALRRAMSKSHNKVKW